MSKRSVPFEEVLYPKLLEDDFAVDYLNTCLEDGGFKDFLRALRQVVEARDINKSQLARDTGINRDNLYSILSEQGNPELKNLTLLLDALGLRLAIRSKRAS